jgi:hypothetical protein
MYQLTGTTQADNITDDELRGLIKSGFANVTLAQRRGESGYAEYQALLSILPRVILDVIMEEGIKFEKEREIFEKSEYRRIEDIYGKRWQNDGIFNGSILDALTKKYDDSDFEFPKFLNPAKRLRIFERNMRKFERPRVMTIMNLISQECDKLGLWFGIEEKMKT